MPLINPDDVRQILDTDLDNSTLLVYIQAADQLVQAVYDGVTDVSSAQKKEIERWLTAHLVASTREPQVQGVKATDVTVQYQGLTGKGLESTHYGQGALALDTTGRLRNLGKRRAYLTAIPSEES